MFELLDGENYIERYDSCDGCVYFKVVVLDIGIIDDLECKLNCNVGDDEIE